MRGRGSMRTICWRRVSEHMQMYGVSKLNVLDHDATRMEPIGVVRLAERADRVAQVQCRIFAAQSWASGRVLSYVRSRANRGLPRVLRLNLDDAGMLNAMLFGDRAGLNKTQRVGFERTGSFHLFVRLWHALCPAGWIGVLGGAAVEAGRIGWPHS